MSAGGPPVTDQDMPRGVNRPASGVGVMVLALARLLMHTYNENPPFPKAPL
jgi:hypothetical protein